MDYFSTNAVKKYVQDNQKNLMKLIGQEYPSLRALAIALLFETEVQLYVIASQSGGTKLAPTLTCQHSSLTDEFKVIDWRYTRCGPQDAWDDVDWTGDVSESSLCSVCVTRTAEPIPVCGPAPSDQIPQEES